VASGPVLESGPGTIPQISDRPGLCRNSGFFVCPRLPGRNAIEGTGGGGCEQKRYARFTTTYLRERPRRLVADDLVRSSPLGLE